MAIEISLIYPLTEYCSGACFLFIYFLLIWYLICTECLLNGLQYLDFDDLLAGINLAFPPPKKKFFITSHKSLCLSV